MYHSLNFYSETPQDRTSAWLNSSTNKRNTWGWYHLIPSSKPVVTPPGVSGIKLIEIPGRSDPIDMTNYISQSTIYTMRTGSFNFYFIHEYWRPDVTPFDSVVDPNTKNYTPGVKPVSPDTWVVTYNALMTYLHGKYKYVILEDDPAHFYEGYFTVSQWAGDANFDGVTLNYQLMPYKKRVAGGGQVL